MTMQLGIQARLWGTRLTPAGLPQVFAEIGRAGYAGVEIGIQFLTNSAPALLRAGLARAGIKLFAVHVAGQFDQPAAQAAAYEDIEKTIRLAAELGAGYLVVSGQKKYAKPAAEIYKYVDFLNQAGALCQTAGLRLCHHNHDWELADDARELRLLHEATDPKLVWFCLDLGWAQSAGRDPVVLAADFGPRLGFCHLRDTSPAGWVSLGRGDIDFSQLLPVLAAWTDWAVVELEPEAEPGAAPYDRASEAYHFLQERRRSIK